LPAPSIVFGALVLASAVAALAPSLQLLNPKPKILKTLKHIDNLVQKLLPTYVGCSVSKDTDLRCEAFTLADGQATKLKTPETPACTTETAFVQKSDAPLEHAATHRHLPTVQVTTG